MQPLYLRCVQHRAVRLGRECMRFLGCLPAKWHQGTAAGRRPSSVALAASTWAQTHHGRPSTGQAGRKSAASPGPRPPPPGTPAAPPDHATRHLPTRWGDCTGLCSRSHSQRMARPQPQASTPARRRGGHQGNAFAALSSTGQPRPRRKTGQRATLPKQTPTSATPRPRPSWCLFVPCMNREARHKTEQKV